MTDRAGATRLSAAVRAALHVIGTAADPRTGSGIEGLAPDQGARLLPRREDPVAITTDYWAGNRVQLQEIESTDLTLVQWDRPRRGAHVLDADELQLVRRVVENLDQLRRGAPKGGGDQSEERTRAARHLRGDLAGSAVHLETLLDDLFHR